MHAGLQMARTSVVPSEMSNGLFCPASSAAGRSIPLVLRVLRVSCPFSAARTSLGRRSSGGRASGCRGGAVTGSPAFQKPLRARPSWPVLISVEKWVRFPHPFDLSPVDHLFSIVSVSLLFLTYGCFLSLSFLGLYMF